MHVRIVLFAAGALYAAPITAQTTRMSRSDAVQAAIERGARVGVARADTAVAHAGLISARTRQNPGLSASYTKSVPNYHVGVDIPIDFPWLRQMMEQNKKFDVVVLDPPKFIPSREDFVEGRAKYFDLNKLGLSVLKPGGLMVTCSCSGLVSKEEFFAIVRGAARSANKRVQVVEQTGPGLDHPVMTDYPESGYLKCMFCRVLE